MWVAEQPSPVLPRLSKGKYLRGTRSGPATVCALGKMWACPVMRPSGLVGRWRGRVGNTWTTVSDE